MEKPRRQKLKKLFLSTLYLSTFTFGGGYVIITLLKNKFVDQYHWIDEEEMLDMVAIAQASPGAVAVNGAITVGYKISGIPGLAMAVLGAIIPPLLILSVISLSYSAFISNPYISAMLNGMRSGVGAVITSVVYDMGKSMVNTKDILNIAIMILSFCASYFFNVNTIIIIIAVAAASMLRAVIASGGGKAA